MDINHNSSTCSYKGQMLEWSASETLYRAYCTLSTHSIKVNYVLIPPTDAAPHFLLKLTPLFWASITISVNVWNKNKGALMIICPGSNCCLLKVTFVLNNRNSRSHPQRQLLNIWWWLFFHFRSVRYTLIQTFITQHNSCNDFYHKWLQML